MAGRQLVLGAAGAAVLLVGACGWEFSRNTATDDTTIDTPIAAVRLASDSGKVTIRAGAATRVHRTVHYDQEQPGRTQRVDGDVLVLDSCPVRNCWIDYDVTVPPGSRVDGVVDSGSVEVEGLSTTNLKIDSGNVTLRRISGEVNLESDSGTVTLSDIGRAVVVRSESGDVTVDNASADVTVHAHSGTVTARGVGGTADLRSDSGNVEVRLAATHNVKAEASSGTLSVTVPRAAYRLRTTTGSGELDSAVTDDPAGGHELDLRTDSGDITVRYG